MSRRARRDREPGSRNFSSVGEKNISDRFPMARTKKKGVDSSSTRRSAMRAHPRNNLFEFARGSARSRMHHETASEYRTYTRSENYLKERGFLPTQPQKSHASK